MVKYKYKDPNIKSKWSVYNQRAAPSLHVRKIWYPLWGTWKTCFSYRNFFKTSINRMTVVYSRAFWRTSHPKPKITKKQSTRNKFLIFLVTKLSSSNTKKFLYFLKRKLFLFFRKRNPVLFNRSLKNIRNPRRENLLYFRKQKPRKNLFFLLKRKLILYFGRRRPPKGFLYFRRYLAMPEKQT